MNTDKAVYWIALGVFALGLNSEYQHGNFVALHRVAERANSVLCRVTTRAEQALAVARVLTSREGFPADDLFASAGATERARDKAVLLRDLIRNRVPDELRAQADVIRAQAEVRSKFEQIKMEQIRLHARSQFRFVSAANRRLTVLCPETNARIAMNAGPEFADSSPED
jgi:hypothetical protein